jgi:hypothetical protein
MVTQDYWDQKAEKAEERKLERQEQLEVPAPTPAHEPPTAPLESPLEETPENPAEVPGDPAVEPVNNPDAVEEIPMSMAASFKEALTAKDYRLIADAIAKSPTEDKQGLAEHFAKYLEHTNPAFDYERFIAAATGAPNSNRDVFQGPGGPGALPPNAASTVEADLAPMTQAGVAAELQSMENQGMNPEKALQMLADRHGLSEEQILNFAKKSRTAEALKTIDVKGTEGPVPEIDKRKWTPENVNFIDAEMDGSVNPTVHQDILEPVKYDRTNDPLEGAKAGLERQDVTKEIGPQKTGPTKTWASSVDGFVPQAAVESAISSVRK